MLEEYIISSAPLGTISSVRVGHWIVGDSGNSLAGVGVHLASVSVTEDDTGLEAQFPAHRWLDETPRVHDDPQILLQLDAQSSDSS